MEIYRSNSKCPNCSQNYAQDLREPFLLFCGHTVCQVCLNHPGQMAPNPQGTTCPACLERNLKYEKNSALIQWLISTQSTYIVKFAPSQSVISEIADGFYRIKAKHSGKYLQIRSGSRVNTAALVQGEKNEQAIFHIKKSGEYFMILSQNSSYVIQEHVVSVQDAFSDEDHKLWKFEKQQDGSYFIINKKTKKCMDVDLWKKDNGAQVIFYHKKPFEKADNQLFYIEPLGN